MNHEIAMEPLYKMKVYYQELGGHTHLVIFTGHNIDNGTCGKAGELIMTTEEFEAWMQGESVISRRDGNMRILFIKKEPANG
jgi:hypothetical protein